MTNVIVVFPKSQDAKNIRNVLMKSGFSVIATCTSGAQALNAVESLRDGIVVCGYRFTDMLYKELHDYLPKGIEMLLVASPNRWADRSIADIVCLPMPIKVHDLVSTLEMMSQGQRYRRKRQKVKPKERSEEERSLLATAKSLLMERNNMSESEAHRYIQKCSMDSGTNMVETAQMVISLMTRG